MKNIPIEPIQKRILLLTALFFISSAVFVVTDTIWNSLYRNYETTIENQIARRDLGKVILNNLLSIESVFHQLASIEDSRDINLLENQIGDSIQDIKSVLGVLQNGGTFTDMFPVNLEEVDEIKISISFSPGKGYVIEAINLTPKILDIENIAAELIQAVDNKVNASSENELIKAKEEIAFLTKQAETLLLRSRENANRIFYVTNQEVNYLKQEKEKMANIFDLTRHSFIMIIGIIVVITFILTISQVRKIIQERSEQRKYLYTLINTIPDLVWLKDPNGVYLSCNPKVEHYFGAKENDIVGKTDYDFISKGLADTFRKKDKAAIVAGSPLTSEEKITYANDGRNCLVETIITPMRDTEGELIGVLGIARDITQRKEAEQKIKQQNQFLNTIIESLTNPFYVINTEDYSIKIANTAAQTQNTLHLTSCHALTHNSNTPCDGSEHPCPLAIIRRTKKPVIVKHIHLDKAGNSRNIEVHGYPIFNSKGDVVQMIEYSIDITERVQAEAQIKASLHEKEILLKEIHHRVKNNLAIIDSLLKFQADITPGEEAKIAFQESQNRIRSMASIHEHLYSSSNLAYINMEHYIQGLAAHLCQTYLSYDVHLKIKVNNVELDLDKAIPCGLILNELISNAFKYAFPASYTPEKEKLIQISMHTNNKSQCRLSVSDNGVGLPPELDIENIEQKSLGLQLVNLLSEQLEGELQINQENGTSFCLVFPVS